MTYLTDEQRRDATQMRDFTTGVNPFGALGGRRRTGVQNRTGAEDMDESNTSCRAPMRILVVRKFCKRNGC